MDDFKSKLLASKGYDREKLILEAVRTAGVEMLPTPCCSVVLPAADGTPTATLWALPDFFGLRIDGEYIRLPMLPGTAQTIADWFGWTLPTPLIVRTLHRQTPAGRRIPFAAASKDRGGSATYLAVNDRNNKVIADRGIGSGDIVSGHRKDIVLTNRLVGKANPLAIYGAWWNALEEQPIQWLEAGGHDGSYVDYSHGCRFLKNRIQIDGADLELTAFAAADPRCRIVSDEGPLKFTRYPTAS